MRQFFETEFKPIGSDAYFEGMSCYFKVVTIDLALIDQQSVGKRSLHLLDTVNAKKRWTTSYILARFANERASFLNMNDIDEISFFGTFDCFH
jgi:hypothetical protein